MKIKYLVSWFIIILCSLICLSGMTGKSEKINELKVNNNGRTSILFDSSWRFHLGDMQDAEKHDFDDSSWRTIDLPHDWSIEDIPGTNARLIQMLLVVPVLDIWLEEQDGTEKHFMWAMISTGNVSGFNLMAFI